MCHTATATGYLCPHLSRQMDRKEKLTAKCRSELRWFLHNALKPRMA